MQTKKRKLNEEPADRADDLVITKETYKGKELVRIEEDEAQERPFVREGIFRLIDLPAELRVYIYQFLMPYNMVITHDRSAFPHNKTCWCISAETKHKNDVQEADTPPRQIKYMLINLPHNNVGRISYTGPTYGSCNLGVACQLFLIDKTISNESLGKSTLISFPFPYPSSHLIMSRRPIRFQHLFLHRIRKIPLALLLPVTPHFRPLRHFHQAPSPPQPTQHPHQRASRRARSLGRQATARAARLFRLNIETACRRREQGVTTPRTTSQLCHW